MAGSMQRWQPRGQQESSLTDAREPPWVKPNPNLWMQGPGAGVAEAQVLPTGRRWGLGL